MKKILVLFSVLVTITFAQAGTWTPVGSETPKDASIQLLSSTIDVSTVRLTLEGFFQREVKTPVGPAVIIDVGESTPILETGSPDLGRLTASLIIPDRAHMQLEVVSASYKEFTGMEVAPSKGNLTRDIDPSTVPYTYGHVYSTDQFFPGKLADLGEPYILRDRRGQAIQFYPFQYNPVTKILRVYTEMTITIRQISEKGVNSLIRGGEPATVDFDFSRIYRHHFLNAGQTRYTPVEEEGNMLIICYGDFMDEMEPFIEWKTMMGRPVEMVNVAQIGNSSAIKSYVAEYYNTKGLTYLLLVGDGPQVPPSYSSGDSDNDYAYIVGSDHYPDIFVGRFSAENGEQVATQVERTLTYEKNPNSDPDWYSRNLGIGSSQGPGDDSEMDYQHIRNMQTDLLNYTYDYSAELFDGSQGGNDAPGNPNPSMVATEINTGKSIILYCGHGSVNAWSTSGFSSSDINNQLTNTGMLPFIWSVACVNGDFKNNTCFAETWLRATQDGQPKGAIATLMSTINQSWNPPMEGQDEMVDILVESYTENIKRTFGGLSMNGCLKMNDSYGSDGFEMTDTWTVFGDPSVVVRTTPPANLTASYQNPLPMGSTQLYVSTNASEGLVCLSLNGEIISTAYVSSNGSATLTFPPVSNLQTRQLTVTAYNMKPFLGNVQISGAPAGATNPYPSDAYPSAMPFTELRWSNGPGGIPDHYKVYVGTNNPPTNLVNGTVTNDTLFILPEELEFETQYYWQIQSFNEYGDAASEIWSFTVASPPDEDFESGSFFSSNWYFGDDVHWTIEDDFARHGNFAAKSGTIEAGMTSSLLIDHQSESLFNVKITFYYKLSSLEGQNFLQFLIDGNVMGEWSGEIDWTMAVVSLTPGLHTFEWKYLKNAAAGPEADHAWIDYIEFPPETLPVGVNAGVDGQVCEASGFTLQGTAVNYTSVEWTTSGDGLFDDPTLLNATYTPGSTDLEAGQAILTLTAFRDDISNSDDLVLTVQHAPYLLIGETALTCEGTPYACSEAEEAYSASLLWSTSGDGTFDDPTILHPVYTPGVNDINAGAAILTLTASGIEPCSGTSQSMPLTVQALPAIPPVPEGPAYVDIYYTPISTFTTSGSNHSIVYTWSIEPVNAGSSDSDGTQCVISWNPDFLGTATLRVKGMNDCGESAFSDGLEVLVSNTVGFDESADAQTITILPNPSNGVFTLEIAPRTGNIISIRIFDAAGNIVIHEPDLSIDNVFSKTYQLDKPGLYFLSVDGSEFHAREKILIW